MPPVTEKNNETKYWRSLEEYSTTGEFTAFVESHFPTEKEMLHPSTRRRFLQVMGASIALAGLTSCRWPKEKIYPHSNRPDGFFPGVPVKFATSMEINGVGTGLLATSYDGRPVKIDGNPSDPNSKGSTNSFCQASVLELYDPDRSKNVVSFENGHANTKSLEDFKTFSNDLFNNLKNLRGKGLFFLSESTSSSSISLIKKKMKASFPEALWFEYEPVSDQNVIDGSNIAFGIPLRTQINLLQANIIVSLDDDILGTHPNSLRYSRDFADGRQVENGSMSRLYAAESQFSSTGAAADHRSPMRAKDLEIFTLTLAKEILNQLNADASYNGIKQALSSIPEFHGDTAFLNAVVKDLIANQGKSVITAGVNQSPVVHAAVHIINDVLGNSGLDKPITYTVESAEHTGHTVAIKNLTDSLKSGKVNTLVIIGGNPVYDAPADLDFNLALSQATNKIHLSLTVNETSKQCDWHVNRAHYLESWGDTRGFDGTHYITQPLIAPLYNGLSASEFLAIITQSEMNTGFDILKLMLIEEYAPSDIEGFSRKALHDGVLANSAYRTKKPPLELAKVQTAIQSVQAVELGSAEHIELTFTADSSVYDGRFNNNGWLQEVPDFITKLTWDNAAYISLETAHELYIDHGEIIKISHHGKEIEIVAYHLPGMPKYSIALPLGYGRTEAGKVGNGTGFNVYPLRTTETMYSTSADAKITPTGRAYTLACTQDHFTIDNLGFNERQKRIKTLIREDSLDHYKEHPDFAKHVGHAPEDVYLWKQFEYESYKWGMSIDLNACTGCNACVVACQAENNIPVVGKDEVHRGREMQWLRIDRYFKGEPDAPEVVHQPLACVHCENAPCEQVCPVAATMHDHEGLNVMVYNRCIGTRYCSNNCPFKVRRFNFFWNHKDETEIEQMVYNPEVTVRTRGVMEKCTYCIQRISSAKITSKNENRRIRDGEITTACQDTCPTHAIQFGDLSDPNSNVSKLHANSRSYTLLDELMVKPRTAYLAGVKNTNTDLAKKNDSSEPTHH